MSYGSFLELVHPDDRPAVEEVVQRCYLEGEPYVENHRVVLPDGRLRWHQGRGRVVMFDGRPVRMFGTGQDVTDRVVGEQALRQSLDEARRLAAENAGLRAELEVQLEEVRASRARIVQAAYEARRRLERDLHDGAQQRLTVVEMTLRAATRQLGTTADPELSRTLGEAVEELSAGAAELRSLARGLHPALLTDHGLMPALEALASRSHVPVTLRHATIGRLDPSVESAAYFVVSEALTNVITENIIDRLQSMLASPLVRDAWDPAAWKCSVQLAVVVKVIPLRSGGFDQLLPGRADPLAAVADISISDTTVASASATGADYVLRHDQRFRAKQGEHKILNLPQHITGRRT